MNKLRGLTLVELMIALALTALVMIMLVYPMMTALGYIQKANAIVEARHAGGKAMSIIESKLTNAALIFDIPPDGSAVTFMDPVDANGNPALTKYQGQPMYWDTNQGLWVGTMERFSLVPELSWVTDSTNTVWQYLLPNYRNLPQFASDNLNTQFPLCKSSIAVSASSQPVAFAVSDISAITVGMSIYLDDTSQTPPVYCGPVTVTYADGSVSPPSITLASLPISINANTSIYASPQYYAGAHLPFYSAPPASPGTTQILNPYVVAHYVNNGPWSTVTNVISPSMTNPTSTNLISMGLDPQYPIDTWAGQWLATQQQQTQYAASTCPAVACMPRDQVVRQYRNTMQSVTPYGDYWDVSQFQVTPIRVDSETLAFPTDSQGNALTNYVTSRYPLWAGRNLDVDEQADSTAVNVYHLPANMVSANVITTPISQWITSITDNTGSPMIWLQGNLYPRWMTPSSTSSTNPFGYQVHIFNSSDNSLQYGLDSSSYNASTHQYGKAIVNRHFMDWPPIDRPDFFNPAYYPAWTPDDIARQRQQGKLVFEQPVAPATIDITGTGTGAGIGALPATFYGNWDPTLTHITHVAASMTITNPSLNRTLTLQCSGSNNPTSGQFRLNTSNMPSPGITFGPNTPNLADGTWNIVYPDMVNNSPRSPLYYICDLSSNDVVVATYSTKAVLDVTLTVTARNRSVNGGSLSRQDYTTHARIQAHNAAMLARGGN